MAHVEIKMNGQKIRPGDMANALERDVIEHLREDILNKIEDIRDPATGEPAKVIITGNSLHDLKFEISGSKDVAAEVKKRLL